MKVRAVKLGYYGHRRIHPGEVFDIKGPEEFSDSENKDHPGWMEKVKAGEEKPKQEESQEVEDSGSPTGDEDKI